jgi:hypothetical protein
MAAPRGLAGKISVGFLRHHQQLARGVPTVSMFLREVRTARCGIKRGPARRGLPGKAWVE